MLKSSVLFLSFISTLFLFSCNQNDNSTQEPKKAKNVILLIGDGMGLTQMSAGTFSNGNTSNFERCQYIGLHKPYASNMLITDSAAGATAFACGIKTYNGAIAVNDDTIAVKTLLEEAEERGLATGLIATSSVVHATPASFIAHNRYRKNYETIAEGYLDTEVDYFVGGGKKHFDARDKDDRNLIKELEDKGYLMSTYFDKELSEIEIPTSTNFGYLTSSEEPLPHAQGRDYLPLAVKKGLDHLSSRGDEKGFFLMIEGSQIDWGGHANMIEYVVDEWKEFNGVIGDVIDWAEEDGETLVVITADHETGGLAIQKESKMDSIVAAFTSDYHTGTMIPVYSYGVGADKFAGIYENNSIYDKIRDAFNWNNDAVK